MWNKQQVYNDSYSYLFLQLLQVCCFLFNPISKSKTLCLHCWIGRYKQQKVFKCLVHEIRDADCSGTLSSSISFTLVRGRPFHCISFLSFEIISIAMRTFKASYTLRLIFFSSYCCCQIEFKKSKQYSDIYPLTHKQVAKLWRIGNLIWRCYTVARISELCDKFICNLKHTHFSNWEWCKREHKTGKWNQTSRCNSVSQGMVQCLFKQLSSYNLRQP